MIDRIERILNDTTFVRLMEELTVLEKDRIYCHHGYEHLASVCRLAYIEYLESGRMNLKRDIIYAAGLLHDIGRVEEYKGLRDHDEAGVDIACGILENCGYNKDESALICAAIGSHRGTLERISSMNIEATGTNNTAYTKPVCNINDSVRDYLAYIIKAADKKSRLCLACKAADTCKWPEDKKNRGIY